MDLTATDKRLLNEYQRDFPLEHRPFVRIARDLEITEDEVIKKLEAFLDAGLLSRVGAVVRPNTVGASTLAAMAVPPDRLQDVADIVSSRPEVNHNYEREHTFNLWFVVTAPDAEAILDVIKDIEQETKLEVIDLPMKESFHIDLGFDLGDSRS